MSVRKSSHGTIFLIVSSGSTLIASSLRSTSKKPFCPMTRSLHPPMTACGHRVRFVATWREEFFEVPNSLTPTATFAVRFGETATKSISIQVSTIDEFCSSHSIDTIDVLKVDTEGCDL